MEDFSDIVYDILVHQKSSISPEISSKLLQKDPFIHENDFPELTNDRCYYRNPLYKELSDRLYEWMQTSTNPVTKLQTFDLLQENCAPFNEEKHMQTGYLLKQLQQSWINGSLDEKTFQTTKILDSLDSIRLILDIIGVRHTIGSIDIFPPPLGALVKSFYQVNKPSVSSLSVGARALSKHHHRDETVMFWGSCTGSEADKNMHACNILYKLLNDVAWVNSHLLPHNVKIFEIRCSQGYGARWSVNGTEFRGFLEPQMLDGHSSKWKH